MHVSAPSQLSECEKNPEAQTHDMESKTSFTSCTHEKSTWCEQRERERGRESRKQEMSKSIKANKKSDGRNR